MRLVVTDGRSVRGLRPGEAINFRTGWFVANQRTGRLRLFQGRANRRTAVKRAKPQMIFHLLLFCVECCHLY